MITLFLRVSAGSEPEIEKRGGVLKGAKRLRLVCHAFQRDEKTDLPTLRAFVSTLPHAPYINIVLFEIPKEFLKSVRVLSLPST
jgi:hypothetical protein